MNYFYELGLNYYNGSNGYDEDIEKAISCFKRALDSNCYEAAYMLGLCYAEGLSEDKTDLNKAVEYMKIADYNYVDQATEWLADYYFDKDFVAFFDYALDLPAYLKNKTKQIILALDRYINKLDLDDYECVKKLVKRLEDWWRRIKTQDSEIKKALATKRNENIRYLCSFLEEYALYETARDDLKQFLKEYADKFDCVKKSFIACDYVVIRHSIENASSLDDIKIINEKITSFLEPQLINNLRSYLRNKEMSLLLLKEELTDEDIFRIKYYLKANSHLNYLINQLVTNITSLIDDALTVDNFTRARRLCILLESMNTVRLKCLTEIENRQKQKEILEEQAKLIERAEKTKSSFYRTHSQIDFNQHFDYLWPTKDINSMVKAMVEAKTYRLSFNYIKNRYGDDFLKEIVCKLPLSFFASDIINIKNEILKRKISILVHFTPIKNTYSIINNGILSRKQLEKKSIKAVYTDSNRLDGFLDYISISITRENYKMLRYKFFQDSIVDDGAEIFEIDPAILYEHPECVIYCNCNAAKGDAASHRSFGYEGFKSMFESDSIYPNNSNMPTDVQSEILFKGCIDKKYIKKHYSKRFM